MNNYQVLHHQLISDVYHNTEVPFIIALPHNFQDTEKYNIYFVLDGNDLMLGENNILIDNNSNHIFIGFSSENNMVRLNDFATYQNSDVVPLMAKHFPILDLVQTKEIGLGGNGQKLMDMFFEELLPFVQNTYHIQVNELKFLGCSMGAYLGLQMLYRSKFTFTKMLLFSPSIWFNTNILNDLTNNDLNNNQPMIINLWVGEKEPKLFEKTLPVNYIDDAEKVKAILKIKANITLKYNKSPDGGHGFYWWINYLRNNKELW